MFTVINLTYILFITLTIISYIFVYNSIFTMLSLLREALIKKMGLKIKISDILLLCFTM